MTLNEVTVSRPEDIEAIVDKATAEGTNLLLLYDKRVDKMLHRFLREFAQSDERFSIVFSGKRMRSVRRFYKEARRSIPQAGYMGSDRNALNDVLLVEGIDDMGDPSEKDVYWIWEKSHVLFRWRPASFRDIFESMASCSREARSGFVDSHGNTKAPWPRWSPKRVVLILTGRSDVMLSEASRSESFFFRWPQGERGLFGDASTQTVAYHLV